MRLPLLWLHDFCDPGLTAQELAHALDLSGTEVERVDHHGVSALEHFVVGKVLTAERHPDADRLKVCTVDVGAGTPSHIVCGAPNVAAGQTVAVARPGSVMPDGSKLKKAKLRGQPSEGMILAEDEVAIGADHDGTMVLPEELTAGTPLADVLPIATDVLELELTTNRPDCQSVYGMAREVHAITGAPLAPAPWTADTGTAGDVEGIEVTVDARDLCPRFTARRFDGVTIGPSPAWLKARLSAAGQRPINTVVDITNYAMLVTGQPLHAFDLERIAGRKLNVRRARDGEQITTLDDVVRTLDPDVCLIEDADGPTSIAGIMGGARSEVVPTTTSVLMEAANWHGPNLQRTSTRLGLRTEASGRFEKGLPHELTTDGLALATQLMLELTGATLAPGTVDVGAEPEAAPVVHLRQARIGRLLGLDIPKAEAIVRLERLGFVLSETDDGLDAAVPYFRRGDVTREPDLIEEVARLYGLDRIPATLPSRRGASGRLEPVQRLRRRAADALVGAGLSESVGWSFQAPAVRARLRLADAQPQPIVLRNPLSEDLSEMRTTLLGSLLDSARRNRSRGIEDVRLFEEGAVYLDRPHSRTPTQAEREGTPLPDERRHLAAVLTGRLRSASWRDGDPPQADVFAAKAVLATLLDTLRVPWEIANGAERPFLHPGRAGRITVGSEPAGWLGELHPAVAGAWDLPRTAAFELDLDTVLAHATLVPRFRDVTSYPAVRQDVAFWLPARVPAADLLATVRRSGGALLTGAEVFDVFEREERTSLAVALEFRSPERTLTDAEVAARREKIVAAVADAHGGELRG